MKKLLLVLLLASALKLVAQQTKIDSLLTILEAHPQQDTARASLMTKIGAAYLKEDPEKAIAFSQSNLAFFSKIKSGMHLAKAYNCIAIGYNTLGKDSLAVRNFKKANQVAEKAGFIAGQITAQNSLGILYSNLGDEEKALPYRYETLRLCYKSKDKVKIATALQNFGASLFMKGDYKSAMNFYFKALEVNEELNAGAAIINTYMNIGLVYKRMDENKRALAYYKKAETVALKEDVSESSANLWENIGSLYDQMGDTANAKRYYNKALSEGKQLHSNRLIASSLTDLGILYNGTREFDKAISSLQEAEKLLEQTPYPNIQVALYDAFSESLTKASDNQLKKANISPSVRFSLAEEMAQQGLLLSKESGMPSRESSSLLNLSQIYERQNKFEKALNAYKAHKKIEDSLMSAENKAEIARREMQLISNKKDAVAKAEIKRQKTIRTGVALISSIALLCACIWFVAYRRRKSAEEMQRELLLKAQISDVEMKALRLQLNPHFIFNSLNSISNYISKNDAKTADYFLAKFAKLMRAILEKSEEKEIPLAEELQMLELYIQLEADRVRKFTYEIKVSPEVDPETTMVPPLILQPFVENSIWHGMAQKDGSGKITIEVTKDNSLLQCIVEDDGVGRKEKPSENRKSYGMNITKDRIELLNKLKNTHASVNLVDLEQGTRVEVTLPLETENP